MIFSKFLMMKRYFTLLFLSSCSLLGLSFSISSFTVINDSFSKTSSLSVVPVYYDTTYVYNDSIPYGKESVITSGTVGYALESGAVIVEPTNRIIEVGRGYESISYGSTTGYGAN